MATFLLKLRGYPGSPWGVQYQVSDAAVQRILAAARKAYGPRNAADPLGPPVDLTDEEAIRRMFADFINGWRVAALAVRKEVAAKAATDPLATDSVTETTDNA